MANSDTTNEAADWPEWLCELDLALGERAVDIDLEYERRGIEAGNDPVGAARLDEVNRAQETLRRLIPYILEQLK